MKRYWLDKRAGAMFPHMQGAWVKYEDAQREIEAARSQRPRRETAQYDPTRDLPVVEAAFVCSAPGVDIDAVHRRAAS